jgi:hypothetical protein
MEDALPPGASTNPCCISSMPGTGSTHAPSIFTPLQADSKHKLPNIIAFTLTVFFITFLLFRSENE